jgi:hypothetical protein
MASDNFNFDAIPFAGSSLYNPFLAKLNPTLLNVPQSENINSLIYPNPAHDALFVNSEKIKKIQVFNLLGQKLKDVNTIHQSKIDISELARGTYLVKTDRDIMVKLIKD